MNEEFLKGIYENIGGKKVGTFEEFTQEFSSNSDFQQSVYQNIGGEKIGTFEEFQSEIGITGNGVEVSRTELGTEDEYNEAQTQQEITENGLNQFGISQQQLDNGTASVTAIGFGSARDMLDSTLKTKEEELKELQGGIFTNIYRGVKSNIKGFFSGYSPEVTRNVDKAILKVKTDKATEELNKIVSELPRQIGTISYGDIYQDEIDKASNETFEGASSQELVSRTNKALKDHKSRLRMIQDQRFKKLTGTERDIAITMMSGGTAEFDTTEGLSEAFADWESAYADFGAQTRENRKSFDKYSDLTKGAIKAIAQAGDDDTIESRDALTFYLDNIINDSENPQAADAQEFKDAFLLNDEQFGFIGEETVLGGAVNNSLLKGSNSIAALFDTVGNLFRADDQQFNSADIKLSQELALSKSAQEVQKAITNNPGSEYAGSVTENVVEMKSYNLSVDENTGKVLDVRRKDGTKVFEIGPQERKAISRYEDNPKNFKAEKDYREYAILGQGAQVMTDMGIIVATGAVTGSALVMYGDLYDEALEETGSVAQAASFAGGTSVLIGLAEKLPLSLEGKLSRALTQTERIAIQQLPRETARRATASAAQELVVGTNWVTRATRTGKEMLKDVPKDILEEAFQEIVIENTIQAAMGGITGVEQKPLTFKDVEETAILTVVASLGPASLKSLKKGGYIEKTLSYASQNLDAFDAAAADYIGASITPEQRQQRETQISEKKKILTELNSVDLYLEDIEVNNTKQREKLKALALQKAALQTEKISTKSDTTKEIIDDKIQQLDKELKDEKVRLYNLGNDAKIELNEQGEVAEGKDLLPDAVGDDADKTNNTAVSTSSPKQSDIVAPQGQTDSLPTESSITNEDGSSDPSSTLDAANVEVGSFIKNKARETEIEIASGEALAKINNAEFVEDRDLNAAADGLYELYDSIDNSPDLTETQKATLKGAIEQRITKIEGYEFRTTNKTVKVTQKKATRGTRRVGKKKRPGSIDPAPTREIIANTGKGSVTTPEGETLEGNFSLNPDNGNLEFQSGDKTISMTSPELGFKETLKDENDTVIGAVVIDPNTGNEVTINDGDAALDIAISAKLRADDSFTYDPIFEEVFDFVSETTVEGGELIEQNEQVSSAEQRQDPTPTERNATEQAAEPSTEPTGSTQSSTGGNSGTQSQANEGVSEGVNEGVNTNTTTNEIQKQIDDLQELRDKLKDENYVIEQLAERIDEIEKIQEGKIPCKPKLKNILAKTAAIIGAATIPPTVSASLIAIGDSSKRDIKSYNNLRSQIGKITNTEQQKIARKTLLLALLEEQATGTYSHEQSIKDLKDESKYKDVLKEFGGESYNKLLKESVKKEELDAAAYLANKYGINNVETLFYDDMPEEELSIARANYNPIKRNIQANTISDIIAEVSHGRHSDEVGAIGFVVQSITSVLKAPYYNKKGHLKQYNTKGTVENDTHSVIEPLVWVEYEEVKEYLKKGGTIEELLKTGE